MAKIGHLSHKDVEYAIDVRGKELIFKTLNEAAGFAIAHGLSGVDVDIDVLVFSEAGAKWLEGEEGGKEYREDPEASVYKRIRVRVSDQGRVA